MVFNLTKFTHITLWHQRTSESATGQESLLNSGNLQCSQYTESKQVGLDPASVLLFLLILLMLLLQEIPAEEFSHFLSSWIVVQDRDHMSGHGALLPPCCL